MRKRLTSLIFRKEVFDCIYRITSNLTDTIKIVIFVNVCYS